jgi:dihydroneopterin aldolase
MSQIGGRLSVAVRGTVASQDPERVTIAIEGLSAYGRHGVYESERASGQRFVADLWLETDQPATDDLDQAVDYSVIASETVAIISGEPVNLIETLAGHIADNALALRGVHRVRVRVHKPEAPMGLVFGDVSVSVTRSEQ